MLNKKVKHEIGLAAVMTAFGVAFTLTAGPAIKLNATVTEQLSATNCSDFDRDGICDQYDARANQAGPMSWYK